LRGNVKWRFKAKRALTSSPVYANGVIFICSVDTLLYALDAKSGYILWRFRMSKASISTPFIADNYIFTGSVDSHIYCIDIHSAREIWNFSTDNQDAYAGNIKPADQSPAHPLLLMMFSSSVPMIIKSMPLFYEAC
jgi:outer membrane protein assembly factor BamB